MRRLGLLVTIVAAAIVAGLAIHPAVIASRADSRASAAGAAAPSVPVQEGPFLAENDAAMTKMMNDMAVKPTGDIDRDFVAMMVPHHQGAIDMAVSLLRYGKNEQLKRLAQEIIVTQQQEIAAMRLAVGEPLPPAAPAPTQPVLVPPAQQPAMPHGSMTMSPGMPPQTK